ncbi:hypothetical protein [Paenibacillus sp. NPDC058174]|uniref:hypothetical protein n=1 Tax=Paenibacillus sp. NPDC058174 TaxID=3346366 RepID=UPI0036D9FCF9
MDQNANLQVVRRCLVDFPLQNANVQFDQPKKPLLSEKERFQMYFCILIAILALFRLIHLHICILFLLNLNHRKINCEADDTKRK